ncbi:MAG: agmatine deiminase family protein [Planctomycetes bacterium]|nr:agmatine deiminase family protein [Planctomycetota bacterium]
MLSLTVLVLSFQTLATPSYPEGADIPRNLTIEESKFIKRNPITAPRGITSPPVGPIHCVAEYEPMDGILLAWEGYASIVSEMAARITTVGNADAIVVIDQPNEESQALSQIASYGGDISRVKFIYRTIDTIWIRDYGPRYVYEGECRAIVDHTYNRPRPNDNALNSFVAEELGHKLYELPLVHGGGNFHLNENDFGWATELIEDENNGMSSAEIRGYWQDYQNLNVTITDAFPTSVDSTQHIDMWMCWASDTTCVISDWPYNSGSTQDQICDAVASSLQSQGYTVVRLPARSVSWTHYTYTNSVICNDLVLVPSYSNSSVSQHNAEALAAWQEACPDKTIVSIPCQSIVTSAGVMHCICMHVPRHLGGTSPTSYLQSPNGGVVYEPGQNVPITWISDDDVAVASVNVEFSPDGGSTWQMVVYGTADDGFHLWQVPDVNTNSGLLRVVAFDADGNSGSDAGDTFFSINGTSVAGDANGDGVVNVADILAVVDAWGICGFTCPADLNGDGSVNVVDLLAVIAAW